MHHFRNLLFSIFILLLPLTSRAGFDGFPITNLNDWAIHTNNYLEQLYEAADERRDMLGLSELEIVNNWIVFDGYSTNTAAWTNTSGGVTNTGTYTNIVVVTNTVTTTNQFTNFVYTLTAGGSATGVPFVTRTAIAEIDTAIENIVDDFLSYNAASDATSWHQKNYTNDLVYTVTGGGGVLYTNEDVTFYPITSIPDESMKNLFHHADIGHVEDAITNKFGIVTNGTAYWTRQPPYTNRWVLAEAHYTGSWAYVEISQFQKRLYETNYPALKYLIGGTNAFAGSVDVTITGTVLDISDQSTAGASEDVTLSSTNWTACTNHWYDISGISPDDSFNTGDVVSLVYTGKFTLFGDQPYVMYASDLNERYEALRRLLWVKNEGDYNVFGGSTPNIGYEGEGQDDVYATAISDNQSDWSAITNAFNQNRTEVDYSWWADFFGDYHVDSFRWSPTSQIQTATAVYTNIPYTWEYFGWSLEWSYGKAINPLTPNSNVSYYVWSDTDGITLSPDVADGNKFNYYAFDTNANTATQLVWNSYVATLEAAISDNPTDNQTPTIATIFSREDHVYQFNIFPDTDIGCGGEYGDEADASGWFYLEYDFEYK